MLKTAKIFLWLAIIGGFLFAGAAYAAKTQDIVGQITKVGEASGWETAKPPQQLIAEIIQIVLSLLGIIFIILMVYGGYELLTAGGEEEKAKKALGIIRPAIVGLLIILMAYGITYFVATRFQEILAKDALPMQPK